MNSLIKLIAFITIITLCVFASKLLTPPSPQELVTSIEYIKNSLQIIDDEKNQLSKRMELGLEDNNNKLFLAYYKYSKINSFLDGGYKLSTPCNKYCDYLEYQETALKKTEELKACYDKYFLNANKLFNKAQKANIAYLNEENITKQEYKKIINDIKIKNEAIITETKNIMELTNIPNEIICTDEIYKNTSLKENNNNEPEYKKIGISQKCYNNCKNLIEAEGYLPTNSMPCSILENKKIIEYSKTHTNMFE